MDSSPFFELKHEVWSLAGQAYKAQLFAGTSGNLSVFDRDSGYMVITPTSVPYETMEPEDMVVMTLDGEIAEGRRQPSSEWRMHAVVYRKTPGVAAIVHTHSPYATAYAAANKSIPCALIEMAMFIGGDVPVAGYATPGTAGVGENAVLAMGERRGCLLANHGVLAVGRDLRQAYLSAVYIEDAARICAIAERLGGVKELSEKDIEIMRARGEGL